MRTMEYVLDETEKMLYNIRRLTADEVDGALSLVRDVFMKFEAPVYSAEGVQTFTEQIIESEGFRVSCRRGETPLYGAFDGEELIGVMGMRPTMSHINLAFVREDYHRKGAATALFKHLTEEVGRLRPEIKEITVNSSPYGLPFYKHMGFIPTDCEQTVDGIRFTPMIYTIGGKT